ncbi:MAG: hypothetical protein IT373_21745 [Polyangiaceae bacterium]|nr:hypothetical protein [Polyangiaceae bacterium]
MTLLEALAHAAVEGLAAGLPVGESAHRTLAAVWLGTDASLVALRASAALGACLVLALVALPGLRSAAAMVVATAVGTLFRAVLAPWPEVPAGAGLGLVVTAVALLSTTAAPAPAPGEPRLGGAFAAGLAHGMAPLLGASPAGLAFMVLCWVGGGGWRGARMALGMTAGTLALELRRASPASLATLGPTAALVGLAVGGATAAAAALAWRWLCRRRRSAWLGVWLLPLGLAALAYDRALPERAVSYQLSVVSGQPCTALRADPAPAPERRGSCDAVALTDETQKAGTPEAAEAGDDRKLNTEN